MRLLLSNQTGVNIVSHVGTFGPRLHESMSLSLYSSVNLCVARFCFKYLMVPYANPSDATTFPNTGSLPIKLNNFLWLQSAVSKITSS